MMQLPRIAILGRPNVGKSALFNRITGRRRALVGNEPGMTRDRLYASAEWQGRHFELIDTGGIVPSDHEMMAGEIFRQAKVAIDQAVHLVLVVDGRAGVVPLDEELTGLLRPTGKPLSLAVNKIDDAQHVPLAAEFHRLGIKEIFPVSAEHGRGVDDLLDRLTADLPATGPEPVVGSFAANEGLPGKKAMAADVEDVNRSRRRRHPRARATESDALADRNGEIATDLENSAGPMPGATADYPIGVAIIGRPNVGKSTLLNSLLQEERTIVTAVPGTTRDAVDAELQEGSHYFRLIDTAGMRRKGKTKLLAEKLSVIQARKHLERSDVAILLLDATEGVTALDTHIGGYAHESRRSVVIAVNKWDAIKKGPATTHDFTESIRNRMKYLDYAPIVFISAQKRQRLSALLKQVVVVAATRQRRIGTAEMNRFIQALDLGRLPIPAHRPMRIYYLTQAGVAPPTFIAFTNRVGKLHFSVERFLENRIRERFDFTGTPVVIKSRARH